MSNVIHKKVQMSIYIGFGFEYNRGRIRIVLHIASFRGDTQYPPSIVKQSVNADHYKEQKICDDIVCSVATTMNKAKGQDKRSYSALASKGDGNGVQSLLG